MQLPAIYRERPITAWTFTIGAMLVIAWALLSRAAANNSGATATAAGDGSYTLASNLPDPNAQLAATTQLAAANLESQNLRYQTDAQFAYQTAALAVQERLQTLGYQLEDRGGERQLAALTVTQQAESDRYSVLANLEKTKTAAARDVEIAQINAQTEQTKLWAGVQNNAVNAQNKTERRKSDNGLIGAIGGIIGGLFSDARLKYDIMPLGHDANGIPQYAFKYTPQAAALDSRIQAGMSYVGVMAQDLIGTRFEKAVGKRAGFYTVNYEALH